MCHLTLPSPSLAALDLTTFIDPICSQLNAYLSLDGTSTSSYIRHKMLKKLTVGERRDAVEIALRNLQNNPDSRIVKRKKPGGFSLHRLVIRKKEEFVRISFIGRDVLAKGSIKTVKEFETIKFDISASTLHVEDEVIAILKYRCAFDRRTGMSLLRDDFSRESQRTVERETALYLLFEDCPYVQELKKFYVFHSASKVRDKVYMNHPRATEGSLEHFLSKIPSEYRPTVADKLFRVFSCCCKALQTFHAEGYYYIDFKADNILGVSPDEWVLGDLESLCTKDEYFSLAADLLSTIHTASPEYLSTRISEMDPEKHEAWSLGISMLEAFGGKEVLAELGIIPIDRRESRHAVISLKQAEVDRVIFGVIERYPDDVGLKDVLLGLLQIEPSSRMCIDEASSRISSLVDRRK